MARRGRTTRVISQANPDVVALQELDVGRLRTGRVDQAQRLAEATGMDYIFFPSVGDVGEQYGDAILSRLPLRLVHAGKLPVDPGKPWIEPRGALWATVDVDGAAVHIFNTHLGLGSRERMLQVKALLGDEWLSHPRRRGPVVLCGDLNLLPHSRPYRWLHQQLLDVQQAPPGSTPRATWSTHLPWARIDHIFVRNGVTATNVEAPRTRLTRLASDHLPLFADLQLDAETTTSDDEKRG